MKCKKCGQELREDAEYCESCGTFTGYTPGTKLNGKQIDTKTYTDAEPVNSRAEKIFSGLGEGHSLNLNGAKNRHRANMNGERRTQTADTARQSRDPGRVTGGDINRRSRQDYTNSNGTAAGTQMIIWKILACVSYLGWFGFLIAYLIGRNYNIFVRFHLNAALILNLMALAASILYSISGICRLIGIILAIITAVGIVIGVISAFRGQIKGLPLITRIWLIK